MSTIRLSRVTRADASDLIVANRASQEYHRPWIASFTDQAGFDTWFARGLTGPNVGLVAREERSNEIVGVINLNEIIAGAFQSAYLGYYGMSSFSRKGLMTEAMRAAIAYAFGDLGLHRLEANIQPENIASIALVRRLGFQREGFSPRYLRINGEWRDHERWALLADAPCAGHSLAPRDRSARFIGLVWRDEDNLLRPVDSLMGMASVVPDLGMRLRGDMDATVTPRRH